LARAEEKKATALKKRKYETDSLAKYQSRKERLATESVDNLCADGRSYEKDKAALRALDASIIATTESIGLIDGTLLPRIEKEIREKKALLSSRILQYCNEGRLQAAQEIESLHREAKSILNLAWLFSAAFRRTCREFFPNHGVTAFNLNIPLPEYDKKDGLTAEPKMKKVFQINTKDGKSYFCQTSVEAAIFEKNYPGAKAESFSIELESETADRYLNAEENRKHFASANTPTINQADYDCPGPAMTKGKAPIN